MRGLAQEINPHILSKNKIYTDKLPVVDEEIVQHFEATPINFWDFINYEKNYTHNIHTYPAMMVAPIPRHLIEIVKKCQPTITKLLDPFAGSGTVLLEGIMAGMNVWGIDLNPLACLITKAKCTPIRPELLLDAKGSLIEKVLFDLSQLEKTNLQIDIPNFKNIDFWFKPYVINHLQVIKQRIKRINNLDIRTLFWVAFSETVRKCSNTRNNEFKLYRITDKKLSVFNPFVVEVFEAMLEKCIQSMNHFYQNHAHDCKVTIKAQDSRNVNLDEKMDLMITSPPYGDSRTTVAYGQFSRLSLQWLDLNDYDYVASDINKNSLDKYLLGGRNSVTENNLPSNKLREALQKIAKTDEKRALDVLSFYIDLNMCLKSITDNMKENSYQCWIVGNRTVKNINIPTSAIISELGIQYNLKTVTIIPRNIPSKRMPKENSPTNVKGKKAATINKENIVILRKVR